MQQTSTLVLSTACAALLLGAPPLTLAHQGATGAVKRRMDFMEAMGDAMKGLGDMLKGKTVYDRAAAQEHAQIIEQHTLTVLGQFPEGSTQPPSKALPIIWEQWPTFEEVAERVQAESAELRAILEDGAGREAVLAQYAEVGRACSACHDRYRESPTTRRKCRARLPRPRRASFSRPRQRRCGARAARAISLAL